METLAEFLVVGERQQVAQSLERVLPALAEPLVEQRGQARVGRAHPAARRHAVGHVDESDRDNTRRSPGTRCGAPVRMQLGHAIDLVRADRGEPGHADTPAVEAGLVDDRHAAAPVVVAGIARRDTIENSRLMR
jgi:hypothetical protein